MDTRTRFMSFVSKPGGEDACWDWTGRLNSVGYGMLQIRWGAKRLTKLAHRLAWKLFVGAVPKGKRVLHTCDNRRCVNTKHLELGTQSKNIKDCFARGRRPRPVGELGTAHKLTWKQARLIRSMVRAGAKQIDMARRYGVSGPTIWELIHGHTWKENA